MKTIKFISTGLALALMAFAPSLAKADGSPANTGGTAASATAVIGAQMDVTEASVNQMMQQLYARKKPSDQFHIADYKAIAPAFQKKIEQGLMLYESNLQNSVLKKLKFWMDRYNSIYSSADFSDAQKTLVLAHQLSVIQAQVAIIDKEYQNDIMQVYGLVGNLSYDLQITQYHSGRDCNNYDNLPQQIRDQFKLQHPRRNCFAYDIIQPLQLLTGVDNQIVSNEIFLSGSGGGGPVSTSRISEDMKYCDADGECYKWQDWTRYPPNSGPQGATIIPSKVEYPNYLPYGDDGSITTEKLLQTIIADKYATDVFPTLAQGCQSQLCVGLRAGDISFFLSLVNFDIDKPIQVHLMDGTQLTLAAPRLSLAIAQKFLDQTNYPVNLPFDTN